MEAQEIKEVVKEGLDEYIKQQHKPCSEDMVAKVNAYSSQLGKVNLSFTIYVVNGGYILSNGQVFNHNDQYAFVSKDALIEFLRQEIPVV